MLRMRGFFLIIVLAGCGSGGSDSESVETFDGRWKVERYFANSDCSSSFGEVQPYVLDITQDGTTVTAVFRRPDDPEAEPADSSYSGSLAADGGGLTVRSSSENEQCRGSHTITFLNSDLERGEAEVVEVSQFVCLAEDGGGGVARSDTFCGRATRE